MTNIDVFDAGDLIDYLGPDGPGIARLPGVLGGQVRAELLEEMNDETRVHWWDAGESYVNARDVKIVQNHDVFALKLSADNQNAIKDVPAMKHLADETQKYIKSMSDLFPALADWQADEMSYHRYYDRDVGLSYHRDNARFVGLIAVASIVGEAEFRVVEREPISKTLDPILGKLVVDRWKINNEIAIPTKPGDIVLTRATGLYSDMSASDRPEHAVLNARVLPRVSFMLRANSKPDDQGYGFTYYNWP